jgi:hypothetical protein
MTWQFIKPHVYVSAEVLKHSCCGDVFKLLLKLRSVIMKLWPE